MTPNGARDDSLCKSEWAWGAEVQEPRDSAVAASCCGPVVPVYQIPRTAPVPRCVRRTTNGARVDATCKCPNQETCLQQPSWSKA